MENSIKNNIKLPIRVKTCFALGEFGTYVLLIFNAMFLLYFYTDIIQIPAAAATVIFMIARIWDAINDPLMGVIVDKTRSKLGKCRFYLKYLSVPAGICIILSYYVPDIVESGKIIWVGVTYILQGMANTAVQIPMTTLMPRLTDNKYERVSLGQYRSVATLLANLMIPAISLPLVELLGGSNLQTGYFLLASIYGIVYTVTHLATYFATKGFEKTYDEEISNGLVENEKNSIKDIVKALISNKMCLLLAASYVIYQVYAACMGSTLVYYLQYNLKNTGLMTMYSILSTVTGIIPILLMQLMVKKLGNAKSTALACATVAVGELVRFIVKDGYIAAIYFGWAMEGVGIGLFASLLYQCMFDAMVYGEWKTGVKNEAVLMSTLTFSQKAGQALGGVVAAGMLTVVNYVPNLAEQTDQVLNLFFIENVTLPMIMFFLLIFAFLYVSKFEKMIPQMKKEIEERKMINS